MRRRRLSVELLEHRQLLALTVDTFIDELDGSVGDGDVSLRDAIASAGAGQTINFDPALNGVTMTLDPSLGELQINKSLTIDASGLALGFTIDADGNSRLLNVDDGISTNVLDVVVNGLTLTGGRVADNGGAITSRENLTLLNSTITDNSAGLDGGGIRFSSVGDLTLTGSTISGNTAGDDGGGIATLIEGSVTVSESEISGNTASNRGGGVFAVNDLELIRSTVSGNQSSDGGGIYSFGGNLTVNSSTISGNSADSTGGGIYNFVSAAIIHNSTITNNEANNGLGSGVSSRGDSMTTTEAMSSIIAGNINSDIDFVGGNGINTFVDGGYNVIGSGNAVGVFSGALTNVANPMVEPLANNGGPTQTHALLLGSPGIDAGINSSGLTTDQRGETRTVDLSGIPNPVGGDGTDVGAFEVLNDPPVADAGGPYTIAEGGALNLDGSGSSDPNDDPISFRWDVDGDGDFDENITGETPTVTWANLVALGIDDGPDARTVRLDVLDATETTTTFASLTVNNVAPMVNAGLDQMVDEGDLVTLQGQFTDPAVTDTHDFLWHLVSASNGQTVADATTQNFSFTPDDNGIYIFEFTVTDDDGGHNTDQVVVTANNAAPSFVGLTLNSPSIDEGQTVTVVGSFTDPSLADTHTVLIDWGDGNATAPGLFSQIAGGGLFIGQHTYADDHPLTGTPFDVLTIEATVTDDDGGSAPSFQSVTINNLDPTVTISGAPEVPITAGTPVSLTSTVLDEGVLDTFTYDWQVTRNAAPFDSGTDPDFSFTPTEDGAYEVTLTVTDDDTGTGDDIVDFIVLETTPPTVTAFQRDDGSFGELNVLQSLSFAFSEDVGASIDVGDLSLSDVTLNMTPSPVDLTGATVSYHGATHSARWDFAGLSTPVPVGRYEIALSAAGVSDAAGNLLDGDSDGTGGDDYVQTDLVVALPGDTDLDGDIDIFDVLDINAFLGGVFPSPGSTDADWPDGDFNGDDVVNIFDILLINQTLAAIGGFGSSYAATPGGEGDSLAVSNSAESFATSLGITVDAEGLARSRNDGAAAWAVSVDSALED